MSDEKRNEWLTPGSIVGIVGLIAAGVTTYSRVDGRISVAEAQAAQMEKRFDRVESKVDFLVSQSVERGGK